MKLLAIAGSLRAESHNRRLLAVAGGLAAERGVEVEILDPDVLRALPQFDEDIEHEPGRAVTAFRAAVEAAGGLLFATPEYNSSVPGGLKNAVDWASRPRERAALAGKPAAVIGASAAPFGAVWAQAELRKILGSAGARVLEGELALGTAQDAFVEGRPALADPAQSEQLEEVLEQLGAEVEQREQLAAA